MARERTFLLDLLRREPNVRGFVGVRACLALAGQMQIVAIGWYIYQLTGSAWHLGFVGLVQFLPGIVLFPLTGHVADHFDRRRVVQWSMWVQALASLALMGIAAHPDVGLWALYVVLAVIGAARSFSMPALSSLLPNLVPAALFPQAVAIGSSVFQIATIVGPAIGGLIYAVDELVLFGVAAGLYFVAIGLVRSLRPIAQLPAAAPTAEETGVLAGLRFIRTHPILLGAISLDLFAVLLGGVTALLPIYARDILTVGPTGLGMLRSAPGVGAAIVGLVLAQRTIDRRAGPLMLACVAGFGLATVVFALSTTVWVSVAALVALGGFDMVSMVIRQTLVQMSTPDAMRGRVSAVHFLFIGASNQLGEFESGVTAALFGAVPAALMGGIGTLAVVALWTMLFPALRRVDSLRDASKAASGA
jgi:MFS family permease